MQERMVRMLPAVKQALPAGDFREWPVIEAWARQIAEELIEPVPVAGATR
jgi:menaquinone-dependent protoporphyrinogen oxidase